MEQTLQSVQTQFAQWRQTKSYHRERIPEHLWELAISLVGHYPQTQITKTLQLNNGAFRRRLKEATESKQLPAQAPHFVELSGLINRDLSASSGVI